MKTITLATAIALASSCLTVAGLYAAGMANPPSSVKLDNERVKVSEVVYQPGVSRDRYTRATDQIIVFLDDAEYQRIDSDTNEKTVRTRKSGDIIWHNKGEDAPVLTNLTSKPYRTLVIEVK